MLIATATVTGVAVTTLGLGVTPSGAVSLARPVRAMEMGGAMMVGVRDRSSNCESRRRHAAQPEAVLEGQHGDQGCSVSKDKHDGQPLLSSEGAATSSDDGEAGDRGHRLARHAAPRAARRISRVTLSPPITPMSVLPAPSPSSKTPSTSFLELSSSARAALQFWVPDSL